MTRQCCACLDHELIARMVHNSADLALVHPLPTCASMQACIAPFLDLRFVTSYTNNGSSISCHTFQRRFSRRYLPYRTPAAAAQQPGMPADISAAAAAAHEASHSSSAGGPLGPAEDAAGSIAPAAAAEAAADVPLLDDAALADSERSLECTLGPVDPSLKMAARKAAHSLVQYVQKAHQLTLRGLVCEFVRDASGHLWFTGPLRANWASLIPGGAGWVHAPAGGFVPGWVDRQRGGVPKRGKISSLGLLGRGERQVGLGALHMEKAWRERCTSAADSKL